ncbi:hypothetical protein PRIPAC_75854 [Pristionchus pacificus]|uniref:Uncharacterized protein n=1 Tax=Pristionchus pacificus TaxID=54126 RepID=A0A2A6B599_PRIPA|nr:hypothetical protein PRIPAC_75854 [Pristionchus pacificus]|eukprot:PDM61057.1 hypothetical protein PRIPAC_54863 [Pristionchus pacificus]
MISLPMGCSSDECYDLMQLNSRIRIDVTSHFNNLSSFRIGTKDYANSRDERSKVCDPRKEKEAK